MFIYSRLSTYYFTLLTTLILVLVPFITLCQKSIPDNFFIDKIEITLFQNINQMRVDYSMPEVQLSASLCYVAELHVNDLQTNNPDTSVCNLSSWSDKGDWTACCYNKYLHNPDCMWDKPKELTPYRYRGYELVTFFEEDFNSDSIINLWSDSKKTLDMILTRDKYANKKWICVGIGISDNYISIWFGQGRDNLKEPDICDENDSNIAVPAMTTRNISSTYYLIFGSHTNMHDAKEACRNLKNDEFKNCDVLVKNDKYRVYLNKFSSLQEAMYAKQRLPFAYREAWILKD